MENIKAGSAALKINQYDEKLCLGINESNLAIKIDCGEMLLRLDVIKRFMKIALTLGFRHIMIQYTKLFDGYNYTVGEKKTIMDCALKYGLTLTFISENSDLKIDEDIYFSHDCMKYYLNLRLSDKISIFGFIPKIIRASKKYIVTDENSDDDKKHEIVISKELLEILNMSEYLECDFKSIFFDDIMYSNFDDDTLFEALSFCEKCSCIQQKKCGEFLYLYKTISSFYNALKEKLLLSIELRKCMRKEMTEQDKKNLTTMQRSCLAGINKFYKAYVTLAEIENKDFCLIHVDYALGGILNRIKSVIKRFVENQKSDALKTEVNNSDLWRYMQ